MGRVSKEQIARARQIPVYDYVLSCEPQSVKKVGKLFRSATHPSLAIGEDGWYWHSKDIGGKTALDYLTKVQGYSFVDAVCALLGGSSAERDKVSDTPRTYAKAPPRFAAPPPEPAEQKPFALPMRNGNNDRVIAYLQSRGIAQSQIEDCIARGVLYESKQYHNAVFVGRDERGKARFAAMRGTLSSYKRDMDGSDKSVNFCLPPDNPASVAVAVFESPIDALSHQRLCKQGFLPAFDGWRLSLGGTSLLALEGFRKVHPQVTRCLVCTDNDEAGELAAAKIAAMPGLSSARAPPPLGKDWNNTLQIALKEQRTQNRARPAPCL
jgi:hypothetical protein